MLSESPRNISFLLTNGCFDQRVGRVLSFFSSRRIGTPPTPHPLASVSPRFWGEGNTRWRERGWESPKSATRGHTLWYSLYTYIFCGLDAGIRQPGSGQAPGGTQQGYLLREQHSGTGQGVRQIERGLNRTSQDGREDRTEKVRTGEVMIGQVRTGEVSTGQVIERDRSGLDRSERDSSGLDGSGRDRVRTGQVRTGQVRTGPVWTGQGQNGNRSERDRSGQDRSERERI